MRKKIVRICALLIGIALLLPLIGCSPRPKTLLTLDYEGTKVTLSVNEYRFLLSRLKGTFIGMEYRNENGATASQATFWDVRDTYDGTNLQTLDEYWRSLVLEDARRYLVGLWIFESNGLELSSVAQTNIQEELDDLLEEQGGGSKTKLNKALAPYGMNYDLLRAAYEIEAKYETAMDFLYGTAASLLGSNVKDQYLSEHYLHFRQIFLAKYTYDDAGQARDLTQEEASLAKTHAEELLADAQSMSDAEFDAAILEENGESDYTDGYYLLRGADYSSMDSSGTLTLILEQLETMDDGQTALVSSSSGWHIIRKYAPTPGAYGNPVNNVWFTSFADGLTAEVFEKDCEPYRSMIQLDEAVYATVPPIKEIEANYYF